MKTDSVERNAFLTEAIGYKIHTDGLSYPKDEPRLVGPLNFSTWGNFGKLWNWAKEQEWWDKFMFLSWQGAEWLSHVERFIEPDVFANALYKFLNSNLSK